MKHNFRPIALGLCAVLLASCGGDAGTETSPPPQVAATTVHRSSGQAVVASDYHNVVQRIYVAYFGRPADSSGLPFFAGNFLAAGASTNIVELGASYGVNAQVTALVDVFGNSQESKDLYAGDNTVFISAIYRNLFNREPDPGGLAFWIDVLERGLMTQGWLALSDD